MTQKDKDAAKQNLKNLIGFDTPKQEQKKTEPNRAEAVGVPSGYILKEEPKSGRLQLLLKPSTLQLLKDRARAEGESVNSLCNKIINEYLNI